METPPEIMERTERFSAYIKELKDELVEEVKLIDTIVVDPLLDIKVDNRFRNGYRQSLTRNSGE